MGQEGNSMRPERLNALVQACGGVEDPSATGHMPNKARDILMRVGAHPMGVTSVPRGSTAARALEKWGLVRVLNPISSSDDVAQITADGERVYRALLGPRR